MTEPDIKPKPKANIRFLYTFCNDVKLIRAFYTDLLGMTEVSFMDTEDFGWLAYQCEGLQYMFFRADSELPHEHRWAEQPGESVEGAAPLMSFSLEYNEGDLRKLVMQAREAGIKAASENPTWRQQSYWGWTVKDPMGNTIELYAAPAKHPEGDAPKWKD